MNLISLLPYSCVHSEELQDKIHLVQEAEHSHDAKRAVEAYPGPASLSECSDGQIPVVAMLLPLKAQ